MHPLRKQRLMIVVIIVVGASLATWLISNALKQNLNLFYSPSQIKAGEAPVDRRMRAGGMVVEGSIQRDPQSLQIEFGLTDYQSIVKVYYTGILPDLFAEGEGAVATGKLNSEGVFLAEQVLAKHDEKYMPPEVADALKLDAKGAPSRVYDSN